MIGTIAKIAAGVVGSALDGFFDWKKGETEKTVKLAEFETIRKSIEADMRHKLMQEANKPDSEFKKFMLDYEGKASDMPRFIQILRGSVRPVVTYWALLLISWLILSGEQAGRIKQNLNQMPSELWYIFLAIFGFWFGGRALQQAVEANQKGKLLRVQSETQGQVEKQREITKQERVKKEVEHEKTRQEMARSGVVDSSRAGTAPSGTTDYWDMMELD